MAYGMFGRNNGNTVILGENIVPLVTTDITRTVSAMNGTGNSVYYEPPSIAGHIPALVFRSGINAVRGRSKVDNYSDYPFCCVETYVFNNNDNIGNVVFQYVAYGDAVTFPSGGYGISIRDENNVETFNSNALLLQPTKSGVMNQDDSLNVPLNSLFMPLVWYYDQPFNAGSIYAQLEQSGTTRNFISRVGPGSITMPGFVLSYMMW